MTTNRITVLTTVLFALAGLAALAAPAAAQTVAYDAGSIYDLDPPANQATGNRILEQVAGSNDMEPVRELGE
ncbi:MAG: hypothetical protein GC150_17380, partial [Rhizobiales bacterium]|nr:hypothetical protein [Hyphomicrobiales bacterium]